MRDAQLNLATAESCTGGLIAGLLTEFYSGEMPEEVLRIDPSFLSQAGITQHLSQNRKNGLGRIWQKIQRFAAEHAGAVDGSPATPSR